MSDDILKKYGITPVKGSGSNIKTESQGTARVGTTKADEILSKYGITPVKGSAGGVKGTKSGTAGSVQSWFDSANSYFDDAGKYMSSWHKRNSNDPEYSSLMKRSSALIAEAYNWRNQYADDNEAVSYINEVISMLNDSRSSFNKQLIYYDQWETEADYQKYLQYSTPEGRQEQYGKNQKRLEELKNQKNAILYQPGMNPYMGGIWPSTMPILSGADAQSINGINDEIDAIQKEMRLYEYGETDAEGNYYGYKTADDYGKYLKDAKFVAAAKNRQYRNASRAELDAYDAAQSNISTALSNGGYYDDAGNVRNVRGEIIQHAAIEPVIQDKLGLFLSASDADIAEAYNILSASDGNYDTTWADIMQEGDTHRWKYLKENEQQIYYGLLYTQGQEAAYKYLDDMEVELGRRENERMQEYVDASSGWQQVGLNALSVPMSMMGGIAATVDNASRLVQGKQLNPYSRAQMPTRTASYIRANTAQEIDETTGNKDFLGTGFTWGDAYQAGMSMIDSLVGARVGGKAYQAVMSMSAASSEATRLYSQGANTSQIVLGSFAAGAAEWVCEKYSIENLINMESPETLWQFVKNMLIQGGIEMSEEAATELANIIADGIIMQHESDWAKTLEKNGGDYWEAIKEMAIQIANAGLGGFISGAGSGSIQQAVHYSGARKENAAAKEFYGGVQRELVDEALEIDPDNDYARRLRERLDKGKELSGQQIRKLVQQNEQAIAQMPDSEEADTPETATAQTEKSETIKPEEYRNILKAAQLPQTGTEMQAGKVAPAVQNEAQKTQSGAVAATVRDNRTVSELENVAANDQQMTDKLTAEESSVAEGKTVTLEEASQKYGAQAGAMMRTYNEGQDVEKFDNAYRTAYDMGRSGVARSYLATNEAVRYLTEDQRELAYEAGEKAAAAKAEAKDAENKAAANGKPGWKKGGVVRGEGVKIADLKKAFNDPRGKAYKSLSTIAKATGINIVLYKSQTDADGNFIGAQGKFDPDNPGELWIDINAGLENVSEVEDLERYVLLRTFSHEFTHFIEKWNPIRYNEFRRAVFDALTERGKDVNDLIEIRMQKDGLDYEAASREVVAEAMVDILPDSSFVQQLAEKHQAGFRKLLQKLKEFVQNLREYFESLGGEIDPAVEGLKEQGKYLDSIVKMFDKIAVEAVETYQKTVATEEVAVSKKESTTPEVVVAKDATTETVFEKTTAEVKETVPVDTKDSYGFTITDNAEHGSLAPATSAIKAKAEEEAQIYGDDAIPTLRLMDREYVVQRKSNGTYTVSVVGKGSGFVANDMYKEGFSSFANASEYAIRWILRNDQEFKTKWPKTYAELTEDPVSETKVETKTQEVETKSEETTEERSEVTTTSEHGFTITDNAQYGSLEIAFDSKPSSEVLDVLKSNKFRWNRTKKIWYGKADRQTITDALNAAYKAEEIATPQQSDFEKAFWNASQEERDEVVAAIQENTGIDHMAPTEIRESSIEETNKEVTDNGKESENGIDARAVYEPVRGSEGPARLLEGVEPETVRGSSEGRQPVQSGSDQGTGNAGRDRRADAAGSVSERSTGDRVGGDLQQLPAVSKSETDNNVGDKTFPTAEDTNVPSKEEKAEQLHEEVEQEIERKSTINPKGSNFVIGDSLNLPSGTKARIRANIEAIKLVKQIAAENRIATPAEQEILSKYVGWGGLADAFGKPFSNKETRRLDYEPVKGMEAEFEDLKAVLTEDEYKSARESTKNAHYTSIEVIKAMYDGLKGLGFTGGRMLEPSSGVGNFVGAMPPDMTAQVKSWTMVELDHITGLFAKYLYPNADVRIQGFEETNIPDGYMDVAIGNVPFGNYGITDKHYPKTVTSSIHNYFFAKSLDKVRTGGIVMFITSSYTMNGRDNAVRKYIMQKADLLGAIRLPNTAFAGNAGTSVVTDILILKKRADKTTYAGEAFENSEWQNIAGGWNGAYVNEYFAKHPEMVLGTAKLTRGMHNANELTYEPFKDRGTLGDQIREAMKNIQGKMEYPAQLSAEKSNFRQASAKKKAQKLQIKDGVIHSRDENGNLTKVDVDKDTAARITGMVAIRDAYVQLCDAMQQGVRKQDITKLRKALNKAYDSFVEKYGYLNAPKNKKAINAFADRYAILSLENYSTEGKKVTVTKSDIFTKDTIAANRTAASAENVEEGLTISLNTTGSVDVGLIARLTGQNAEGVTRQLIDQRLVFKDKDGNLIPASQYLSGNVRAKLREMEGLTGIDKDYINNVEALREVVPPVVQHTDIYVNPGANWVPVQVYEDFVGYILKRNNYTSYRTGKKDFSVEYVPETNEYKVTINEAYAKQSAQNTQVWGEGGKSFNTIFENMLNGRRTNVYRDRGDGTRELDRAKTEAVAEKVEKLNEEFRKWLWEDDERRADMQELYNETYNALVTPKYSGATLTVNGLNSTYTLRDHQKDAVARIINSGGNTLLAHRVGAGKTMEMAAAAMKLKQLGVIKKPMFVVPNNVVAQWGKEFKDYFPAANILLVGDEDMNAAERMTTINRIKNNDYDAVILAYTKFEKIQMTTSWRQKFYEEQIDSLLFAINAEKESQGGKGFTVKQLEAKRKQLEGKLKKLTDKSKDEDGAMFEDLGVDSLFVDEAHNFKNLEYSTRMTNVSGLGKADGAQRSFDLYTKVRYLQQLNGGRGVVFATATPVMNSMTEMYIMQKYLQPDILKQLGIEHFDSWAKMFGEVVNALEIAPSGSGYRLKQTFSKFKNVKALQQMFRSFTDVLTDVPGLKIPKMKGRKVQIVECEQGEFQKNYMAELAKRAENVKRVDPSEDNMLKITSDGRKISYSQRMIDPSLPYEETGKIYKCCDNVYAVYQESNKTKGTQMIFCDMATPKGKSSTKADPEANADEFAAVDTESAQLYDDMKARLIQLGIPAKEIAFIHDAKNDKQKAELAEKMNNGTIRVLIGSTGKMGVGLNAQKKAVAIHHLDAPWRPGDIEQRDGRVFRQKNENEEAYKFVYVTRGSFDSRLWDILERKQKFINQVMNGEDVGNEIEDTGEVTLSAAEVKAVASDNPLIMEQVALEKEISKLQSLQQAYQANISRARERIAKDRRNIAILENLIENGKEDIRSRKDTYSSDKVFSINIGKHTYTDKKDAGTALVAAAQAQAKEGEYTDIGTFAGFTLRIVKTNEGIKGMVSGNGSYEFKTYPLNPGYGIAHLISVVEGIDEKVKVWNRNLGEAGSDLQIQNEIVSEPFDQAEKLRQKRARYNEVMDILNPPKEEQNLDTDGGDAVQYQQRNRDEDKPKKRKKATYNEAETLFMIWENSSAPVGEVKRFVRFGKIRYFEKTESGSIELSMKQYNERNDRNAEKTYERIQRQINGTADSDEFAQRNMSGSLDRNRNTGRTALVSGKTFGEELRNDAGRSLSGGSGYSSGTAVDNSDETQYQQRHKVLTNREVLEMAMNDLQLSDLTPGERTALDILKGRLEHLKDLQDQRKQQGETYRQQQFGTKTDREEAKKTLNRMKVLDGQIERAKEDVLSIEDKQVLKTVLQKARKVVEKQQWTQDQETLKRWRDRRNNADSIRKYRTRLKKDVDELTGWVLHPNNKDVVKHIPEVLKSSVIPFLSSVDFTSKQQLRGGDATKADQQFMKRLAALQAALDQKQDTEKLYADYTDLPPDFMEKLKTLTEAAKAIVDKKSGEFVVNQMTSAELKALSEVVRNLKAFIQNFNRFHYNSMFRHVFEAGDNSIDFMDQLKPAAHTGGVSKFVLWDQMRPAYAFERFGEGGVAIYDGLRRGQATMAFNTKKIADFAEKAYTPAEVQAWEKEVKTIELEGSIVKMPVSTIMSFYELSKRPQALGHILGAGVRVATFKANGRKIADSGHKLTIEDVNTIIDQLTDRQKEVADNLQKFMQEQGGKWGNYVSMKRFGEKLFGEDHYFPINSDGRYLPANAEEKPGNASLYALLNMGFTKATTENASNQIVLYSIFDVFSSHMASMAQYNAFALPVVDALKWFNYQQKGEPDENGKREVVASVRDLMDKAYGTPEETRPGSGKSGYAQNFVIHIIKAFNGTEAQGTQYDNLGMEALHRYNRAQVSYNLRVVMQQPLAITRAAQLIDYASIIRGMKLKPNAIRKNIEEMQKYSGIAAWKALGFYDVNISRGLTSIIKHDETWQEKVIEVGMKGAETADTLTWAGIWSACKEEVMRKQKLKPSDAGFYDAVTKLFEDVIYKTQVVDSVLTKNEFMRDKGFLARSVGSFMSEPTTTASMLIDAFDKLSMDMRRGQTLQQAWKKNGGMIVRTVYVYGVGAVLLAAIQAAADALRDDDEYQTMGEKWLEAFAGNLVDELVPFNKLPVLSELYEFVKGLIAAGGFDIYAQMGNFVWVDIAEQLIKGTEIIHGKITGTEDRYTWYGGAYKILQGVSGIVGFPMAAATREFVTALNNTVGAMAPSLKIKSYDAGDWSEIKYAYLDGHLTEDEATNLLIDKKLVSSEDQAYFTIREWESGEGYSRYNAIYDAVKNNESINAAMGELTSHGYSEKEVLSEVKEQIGKWYKEGKITKQQATSMLSKYFDMDSEEVTAIVNKWSSKVVTGISFEDIKYEYMEGNITASRAIDMYTRYGGYTRESAMETVSKWKFEQDYGFAYDDRVYAYKKGLVNAATLRKAMIEFGGLTETEADNNLRAYEWMKKNPEYNLTVNTVLQYTKPIEKLGYSVEESGIKPDAFQAYTKQRSECKGVDSDNDGTADRNSVKNQVMEVIDDMPIAKEQKDTLYYLNGWAASTLHNAPWH